MKKVDIKVFEKKITRGQIFEKQEKKRKEKNRLHTHHINVGFDGDCLLLVSGIGARQWILHRVETRWKNVWVGGWGVLG